MTDELAGALRVAMMLRSRRYHVRDLHIEVANGVGGTQVRFTALLTEPQTALLLARLQRLPVVVSAESA